MREVAQSIYEVPILGVFVNLFVIAGETLLLVDAGLPGRSKELLGAVRGIGRDLSEIQNVAVTHHHVDHIGGLAWLVKKTGAQVFAHPKEALIVRGDIAAPPLVGRSWRSRLFLGLLERIGPTQSAPTGVDHELEDGVELEGTGLRAIFTPGHTAGHTSFLHSATGTLFVGDAAANGFRGLARPVGNHDEDVAATTASIVRLANLDFDSACFGHGRSISGGARRRFLELADRLAG
jgi:glyoxylase-like metal-dependent hydrolase (beta-lactamase superfamily II)